MERIRLSVEIKASTLALVVALFTAGCGKKTSEPSATTTVTAPDTGAAATATSEPATPQPSGPAIIVNNINTADTKAAMSAATEAIKARQYEDATKLMLALQAQKLNEQQAAALHGQMMQLQKNLADGIANGDPNAQAAAEMLRESAKHR
jgi:hypothetical protein